MCLNEGSSFGDETTTLPNAGVCVAILLSKIITSSSVYCDTGVYLRKST